LFRCTDPAIADYGGLLGGGALGGHEPIVTSDDVVSTGGWSISSRGLSGVVAVEVKMNFKSYFKVVDPSGRVRFSSVYQDDAVWVAQELFRRENVFCEVEEVERG
jgi:hypothetical protein